MLAVSLPAVTCYLTYYAAYDRSDPYLWMHHPTGSLVVPSQHLAVVVSISAILVSTSAILVNSRLSAAVMPIGVGTQYPIGAPHGRGCLVCRGIVSSCCAA
jgi:hypothetical protein